MKRRKQNHSGEIDKRGEKRYGKRKQNRKREEIEEGNGIGRN